MNQDAGLPEIDNVEDVVSDVVSNSQGEDFLENKAKPIPKGLKYGLMALPVALIVGIFSMNSLKGSEPDMQIGLDGEMMQIGQEADQSTGVTTSVPSASMALNEAERKGSNNDVAGKLKLSVTPMQMMQEQLESISSQMAEINGAIDRLEEQGIVVGNLKTQVTAMEEQLKHVPTREELEQVKTDFASQLEAKAEELKTSLSSLYKKAKRAVTPARSRKVYIPFRLVSIDQWDGVNYAAIQSNNVGGIENLREGDSRSGWVVSRIDSMKMAVTFQHTKTGRKVVKNTI